MRTVSQNDSMNSSPYDIRAVDALKLQHKKLRNDYNGILIKLHTSQMNDTSLNSIRLTILEDCLTVLEYMKTGKMTENYRNLIVKF